VKGNTESNTQKKLTQKDEKTLDTCARLVEKEEESLGTHTLEAVMCNYTKKKTRDMCARIKRGKLLGTHMLEAVM